MSVPSDSRVDEILGRLIPPVERVLMSALPKPAVHALTEFLVFGIKQAWSCLFGGLLLAVMILTNLTYPDDAALARYDFLLLCAVAIQVVFLMTRLERPSEAMVILMFHLVGTAMEVFKTEVGSWTYPEDNMFRIGGVPLFSGFMYAAVGSYLARASRVFDFRWSRYPWRGWTLFLVIAIYINFFSHHWIVDVRYGLFIATAMLFWPTQVHYRVWRWHHRMPLLVGFLLVSLFIWIAENIATLSQIWLYPNQTEVWQPVSIQKLGSWYLLMILSWVLVTIIHRPRTHTQSQP